MTAIGTVLTGTAESSAELTREIIIRMKEKLRRAVLTLIAVPDPDKRYLRVVGPNWQIVRDSAEAYGWTPERVHFTPTPKDVQVYLDVLSWLSWYEREYDDEGLVKIFIAWATGAEYWKLSKRFSVSERTIRRRIDGLAATIAFEFDNAFQKLFLDGCPIRLSNPDSLMQDDGIASPSIEPVKHTPTAWIADGEKPSADTSIPAVAEARTDLIERIDRQNNKRRRKRR